MASTDAAAFRRAALAQLASMLPAEDVRLKLDTLLASARPQLHQALGRVCLSTHKRNFLTNGIWDVSHNSTAAAAANGTAAALLLIYLVRPAVFGTRLAAAAFAALAAPLAEAVFHQQPLSPLFIAYAMEAETHMGWLKDAVGCPGFVSAVAAERPDAFVALAYIIALQRGHDGSRVNATGVQRHYKAVAAAFAPAALQAVSYVVGLGSASAKWRESAAGIASVLLQVAGPTGCAAPDEILQAAVQLGALVLQWRLHSHASCDGRGGGSSGSAGEHAGSSRGGSAGGGNSTGGRDLGGGSGLRSGGSGANGSGRVLAAADWALRLSMNLQRICTTAAAAAEVLSSGGGPWPAAAAGNFVTIMAQLCRWVCCGAADSPPAAPGAPAGADDVDLELGGLLLQLLGSEGPAPAAAAAAPPHILRSCAAAVAADCEAALLRGTTAAQVPHLAALAAALNLFCGNGYMGSAAGGPLTLRSLRHPEAGDGLACARLRVPTRMLIAMDEWMAPRRGRRSAFAAALESQADLTNRWVLHEYAAMLADEAARLLAASVLQLLGGASRHGKSGRALEVLQTTGALAGLAAVLAMPQPLIVGQKFRLEGLPVPTFCHGWRQTMQAIAAVMGAADAALSCGPPGVSRGLSQAAGPAASAGHPELTQQQPEQQQREQQLLLSPAVLYEVLRCCLAMLLRYEWYVYPATPEGSPEAEMFAEVGAATTDVGTRLHATAISGLAAVAAAAAAAAGSNELATLLEAASSRAVMALGMAAAPPDPDLVEDCCAVAAAGAMAVPSVRTRFAGKGQHSWHAQRQRLRRSLQPADQHNLEPMLRQVTEAVEGRLERVCVSLADMAAAAAADAAQTESSRVARAEAAAQALLEEEAAAADPPEGRKAQRTARQHSTAAAAPMAAAAGPGAPPFSYAAEDASAAVGADDNRQSPQPNSKKAQKRARQKAAAAARAAAAAAADAQPAADAQAADGAGARPGTDADARSAAAADAGPAATTDVKPEAAAAGKSAKSGKAKARCRAAAASDAEAEAATLLRQLQLADAAKLASAASSPVRGKKGAAHKQKPGN